MCAAGLPLWAARDRVVCAQALTACQLCSGCAGGRFLCRCCTARPGKACPDHGRFSMSAQSVHTLCMLRWLWGAPEHALIYSSFAYIQLCHHIQYSCHVYDGSCSKIPARKAFEVHKRCPASKTTPTVACCAYSQWHDVLLRSTKQLCSRCPLQVVLAARYICAVRGCCSCIAHGAACDSYDALVNWCCCEDV